MKHIILCAAVLLTACATTNTHDLRRYPQAADMLPCQPLEKPADGTLASLYRYGVSAAHRYHDCSARHGNLVDWITRE